MRTTTTTTMLIGTRHYHLCQLYSTIFERNKVSANASTLLSWRHAVNATICMARSSRPLALLMLQTDDGLSIRSIRATGSRGWISGNRLT